MLWMGLLWALTLQVSIEADPYLWLEEIDGDNAMKWVEERNKETLAELESDPRFAKFREQAEAILQDKERIPYGRIHGGFVYNFWQDSEHVRGLWRRVALAGYEKPEPDWEILLDVDALAKLENENWVFQQAELREPDCSRAMISLSRGGSDASVWREFDVSSRTFLPNGFRLEEAKSRVAWFGADELAIGTNFGPGSLTTSGYPRVVKLWQRSTPMADARTIYEAKPSDVGIQVESVWRPEGRVSWIGRSISFFNHEYFLVGQNGDLRPVPVPTSAEFTSVLNGWLYFLLREPLVDHPSGVLPSGSLVRIPMDATSERASVIEGVLVPDDRQSVQQTAAGRTLLNVALLDNVAGQILRIGPDGPSTFALPANGNVSIISTDDETDGMFVAYAGFLDPPSLYWVDGPSAAPRQIKSLPHRFDSAGLVVHRRDATSSDGTKVPYFIVQPKDVALDGSNPTLLYAYGGFEIPMLPTYSATVGKLWLEHGGVYVLACIRGGGEFGPRWHQAALKENRQRAYDDFLAVAEDLIATKITSPPRLGIMGGSNGGLLVAAAFTQRPELFGAVVCSVPLLDMVRYTKLLAGASWIGEYGDPEDAAMRERILGYSPYQNVKPGVQYPRVFFETSTKDDRVHPGHARKMVAKMLDQGHRVYYFENTEGGHSAAANLLQRARRIALEFVYLHRMLMDGS